MAAPKEMDAKEWEQIQREMAPFTNTSLTLQEFRGGKAERMGNDPELEKAWALKAYRHAETYFSLIKTFKDKKKFKLSRIDDQIYDHFRKEFPKMQVSVLDEVTLKSAKAKEKWRVFCQTYEKNDEIPDYNFGTLLRMDCRKDVHPANTTLVPKIQFIAIEIARNREGWNDALSSKS